LGISTEKSASKSAKVKGDTNSQDAKKRKSGAAPLTVDPKRFTIGSSAKREVIGGSNYSRSLLADGKEVNFGKYFARAVTINFCTRIINLYSENW